MFTTFFFGIREPYRPETISPTLGVYLTSSPLILLKNMLQLPGRSTPNVPGQLCLLLYRATQHLFLSLLTWMASHPCNCARILQISINGGWAYRSPPLLLISLITQSAWCSLHDEALYWYIPTSVFNPLMLALLSYLRNYTCTHCR